MLRKQVLTSLPAHVLRQDAINKRSDSHACLAEFVS
jgi:hypothetical protein